jgi:hypothetical protein
LRQFDYTYWRKLAFRLSFVYEEPLCGVREKGVSRPSARPL